MEERPLRRYLPVSLALHVALLAWVSYSHLFEPSKSNRYDPDKVFKIVPVPKSALQKKIVKSDQGIETDVAEKDAYLGEKTRVVQKEMVGKTSEGNFDEPKPKSNPVPKTPKLNPFLSRLGVPLLKPVKPSEQLNQANWSKPSPIDRNPHQEYIKGLKQGEYTALNTKEYTYYSYFARIRRQLDQAWRPLLGKYLKAGYKRGRSIASKAEHVTQTLVTLSDQGEVTRVQVIEASGTRDLDNAAVDAFNEAGPFPNPPSGLVDQSGNIQVRWDFILRT